MGILEKKALQSVILKEDIPDSIERISLALKIVGDNELEKFRIKNNIMENIISGKNIEMSQQKVNLLKSFVEENLDILLDANNINNAIKRWIFDEEPKNLQNLWSKI